MQAIRVIGLPGIGIGICDNQHFVPAHSEGTTYHQQPLVHEQTDYDNSHSRKCVIGEGIWVLEIVELLFGAFLLSAIAETF